MYHHIRSILFMFFFFYSFVLYFSLHSFFIFSSLFFLMCHPCRTNILLIILSVSSFLNQRCFLFVITQFLYFHLFTLESLLQIPPPFSAFSLYFFLNDLSFPSSPSIFILPHHLLFLSALAISFLSPPSFTSCSLLSHFHPAPTSRY